MVGSGLPMQTSIDSVGRISRSPCEMLSVSGRGRRWTSPATVLGSSCSRRGAPRGWLMSRLCCRHRGHLYRRRRRLRNGRRGTSLTALALDTSVAIPLLVATHRAHAAVSRWCNGQDIALSGHAVAETYSVLTRLPGPASGADRRRPPARRAVRHAVAHGSDAAARLTEVLSRLGIAGGAVYDALVALVALAALEHGADLATRDARARATYEPSGYASSLPSDSTHPRSSSSGFAARTLTGAGERLLSDWPGGRRSPGA
jgi:predicted nucleic acid-binding protein